MSAHSSAASVASTSDWSEPVCASCGSARPIPGDGMCCDGTGPTRPAMRTWFVSENQRAEVLLTDYARQLTGGGGKPGQGYPMVFQAFMPHRTLMEDGTVQEGFAERPVIDALHQPTGNKEPLIVSTSSAEASPARISASPAGEPDSTEVAAPSSSSSHESLSLFAPAGFSSRTYPDYFPLTVDEISPSYSRRWPSSGMAFAGECWTLDSSEFPSGAVECSLSDILEPEVPSRFYLSSRAAKGILRRAEKRGRMLPSHLSAALEAVARMTTTGKADA